MREHFIHDQTSLGNKKITRGLIQLHKSYQAVRRVRKPLVMHRTLDVISTSDKRLQ